MFLLCYVSVLLYRCLILFHFDMFMLCCVYVLLCLCSVMFMYCYMYIYYVHVLWCMILVVLSFVIFMLRYASNNTKLYLLCVVCLRVHSISVYMFVVYGFPCQLLSSLYSFPRHSLLPLKMKQTKYKHSKTIHENKKKQKQKSKSQQNTTSTWSGFEWTQTNNAKQRKVMENWFLPRVVCLLFHVWFCYAYVLFVLYSIMFGL